MKVRLKVVGGCSASVETGGAETPLTTSTRLLYHLALGPPEGIFRSSLAQDLWPQDEPAACRNRLRVALSKLRAKVPGIVVESKNRLALDADLLLIDIQEIRARASAVEDSVSPAQELEGWLELKEGLSWPLAQDLNSEALQGAKAEWSEWAGGRLRRGSELALALGRFDIARDLAIAGLGHLDEDDGLWQGLLAACRSLGDLQPARVVYARLAAEAKRTGRQLLSGTLAYGTELRAGSAKPEADCSSERRLFSDSFLREALAQRPDLVLPLLAAPELLGLVGANPRQSAELLAEAVSLASPSLPQWPRCAGRLIGLWAWLDETQKVQDLAPIALESTEDPLIRRAVFNALAAAAAIKGDWVKAEKALDETKLLAEEAGSLIDAVTVEGNRACYWWMQGRYADSDRLYEKVLDDLGQIEGPRSAFERAVAVRNRAFIPVMQGMFEEAKLRLDQAAAFGMASGVELPEGLELPCRTMLRIWGGELEGASRQMKHSLMSLFDKRSDRMKLAGLEYAAISLFWLGLHEQGDRALEQIDHWRRASGFPRCVAEMHMIAHARHQATEIRPAVAVKPLDLIGPEELGAWIVRVIRKCENSA